MHLKMSSGKLRPFSLALNVLNGATKRLIYIMKKLQNNLILIMSSLFKLIKSGSKHKHNVRSSL